MSVTEMSVTEMSVAEMSWPKLLYEPWHELFQQCGILTSIDSDEPGQPSFKLGNHK